jgi:hypothetical protein
LLPSVRWSRSWECSSPFSLGRVSLAVVWTDRTTRRCVAVAALLVLVGLVHLGVQVVDDRPWSGPVSWRKPATFGVSFGLTLAAVTWITTYLRLGSRTRRWLLGVLAVDSVLEVGGITAQAWRGVPSHLNTSTPTNAAVAFTLAAGGAVLVVVLGILAGIAVRGHVHGPPEVVLAVRVGFGLLLVGLFSGVSMIARGSVVRRAEGADAAYAAAGFLKSLHGVTLHAVLILPAVAVLLGRSSLAPVTRHLIVAAASTAYIGAALFVAAVELS